MSLLLKQNLGDSKAPTVTASRSPCSWCGAGAGDSSGSTTTGWHLGLLTDHRRERRRRKERAFKGYLGTNGISPKKENASIWFLKILKSNLYSLKVYFNVRFLFFYRQCVCTHTWKDSHLWDLPRNPEALLKSPVVKKPLQREVKNSEFQTEGVSINKLQFQDNPAC